MLTLFLSNIITIENYQKIIAIISLCVDVLASVILVIRVLKSKNIDLDALEKLNKSTNKNKKTILKAITELLKHFEEAKEETKEETKETDKKDGEDVTH